MLRLGPILIATVAILTAGADAQVHDPPLFAAFKAFCVDTGARPGAVKSAVEATGGKQLAPPGATGLPFPMTVTGWDITTGGHSMNVSAGTQQIPPVQNRPEENSNQCIVRSFVNEDASIEAIRNWVGIPPAHVSQGNLISYFFNYQESGAVRSALPAAKTAHDMAKAEGRTWSLVVLQSQDGASVQLVHHLASSIRRRDRGKFKEVSRMYDGRPTLLRPAFSRRIS
jgi:hypothetical protein